jgi:2-methylisocitrate lyase-like PEP mutase family enzyme
VCASVGKPVNVLAGMKGTSFTVAQLAELGARRTSLGSTMSRAALGGFVAAAREILEQGTFDFVNRALPYADANAMVTRRG